MKYIRIALVMVLAFLLTPSLSALTTEKATLNKNMTLRYNTLPASVDTFNAALGGGKLYGRLRMNTFYHDWNEEINATQKDNKAMGVGGSLIYKTASLQGLSATLGLYTSKNPYLWRVDREDVGFLKAGKDTFMRNRLDANGTYSGRFDVTSLAQAYVQYDIAKTSITAGRQLFESPFTASNDTKMIPNAFFGVSASIRELPGTTINMAYFTKQKLRDHESFHDVIAYDGWNQNDDSAVNKSLTKALVGDNNRLIIATIENSLGNLKTKVGYLLVPHVLSNMTLEGHYKVALGDGWSLTPGARLMKQMDELGTDSNVSSLKGSDKIHGYTDPTKLDGSLFALRLDAKKGPLLLRLGYSKIRDKADIIAPWRGFPTGGFTRAMAQYNWYANTRTGMVRLDFDFGKAGLIPGYKLMMRYAMQDFDDAKDNVQADSNVLHIDMLQQLTRNLEMKLRIGLVDGDTDTLKSNGIDYKTDISYNEYRLEFNYLF